MKDDGKISNKTNITVWKTKTPKQSKEKSINEQ